MNARQAEEVVAEILQQVAPNADLGHVDRNQDMRRALDLDSVDFLTVLQRLAERTGIEVPEACYAQVASLGGMVDYLVSKAPG